MAEKDRTDFVLWEDAGEEKDRPPPLNAGILSWRMTPEESHSDWKIEIIRTTEPTSNAGKKKPIRALFHVHKNILALGPKKSGYFSRIFRNPNFAESESKTSKIELNKAAAGAFPTMLDFLYSHNNSKLEISTKNAVALHFLGQYFEIHHLRWEAARFCKENISTENIVTYYEQGKLFHDEMVLKMVAIQCCKKLEEIDLKSKLMELSDVALWRNIIHLFRQGDGGVCDSAYLSRLIAEFCSSHRELVDSESFAYLTDANPMEKVDKDAAIQLLQLEGLFLPNKKTSKMLSSLQYRCIDAIASKWEAIDVSVLRGDLHGLNPGLMDFAFARVLEKTKINKKKLMVNRIVVSGAGVECCNGTYTRTDDEIYYGAPVFAMDGTYEGQSVLLEIYRSPFTEDGSPGPDAWFFTATFADESYSNFYTAPHNEGNKLMPPANGWTAVGYKKSDLPMLRFLRG